MQIDTVNRMSRYSPPPGGWGLFSLALIPALLLEDLLELQSADKLMLLAVLLCVECY